MTVDPGLWEDVPLTPEPPSVAVVDMRARTVTFPGAQPVRLDALDLHTGQITIDARPLGVRVKDGGTFTWTTDTEDETP